jgi:hypothetical protein
MSFDRNKPFQTRNGRKVQVLAVAVPGKFPIVGLVEGYEASAFRWKSDGNHDREVGLDLVNVPMVEEWFQNLYSTYFGVKPMWHKEGRIAPEKGCIGYVKMTKVDGEITKVEAFLNPQEEKRLG